MEIAFWILTVLTAVVFIGAGLVKQIKSKDALKDMGMAWAEDFSQQQIRLIGIAEILGGLGVVLPILTGIATFLAPIAAGALAVLMVGATLVHIRRKEPPVTIALVLIALATCTLGIFYITR